MLLNTTHKSLENEKILNELLGKSLSLFEKIKLGGVGCKRMIIDSVSPNISNVLNNVADINYCNIELRPKGILLHITKGLQTFAWAIPYYQLVIYKNNGTSVHAQGKFIRFKNNINLKENKPFFNKLIDKKVKYDALHAMPSQ